MGEHIYMIPKRKEKEPSCFPTPGTGETLRGAALHRPSAL